LIVVAVVVVVVVAVAVARLPARCGTAGSQRIEQRVLRPACGQAALATATLLTPVWRLQLVVGL
jgi:hypothetical protein